MTETQPKKFDPSVQLFTCPICHYSSRRLFRKSGYWIRACDNCQHQFVEIEPTPNQVQDIYNAQYFHGTGPGYLNYLAEGNQLRQKGQNYARLLASYLPSPGVLLDVGAAAGFILRGFIDQGWQGLGLEPNEGISAYARQRLNLQVQVGTLEEFNSSDRYDLVTMIRVLPHFYDLRQALQSASTVTKSGGYWLIETQNRDHLLNRFYGQHWREYTPPVQRHWFSPFGLRELARQYGFREIQRGKPMALVNHASTPSRPHPKLAQRWRDKLFPTRLKSGLDPSSWFWVLFQKGE